MGRRALAALAVVLTLAACGGEDEETAATQTTQPTAPTTTAPTTTAVGVTHVRLYYLDAAGKLRAVPAQVRGGGVAAETLRALLANEANNTTEIPLGTVLNSINLVDGVVTVDLSREFETGGGSASMQARVAQVVYTLTQWPTIRAVTFELDGEAVDAIGGEGVPAREVGRDDVTDPLPAILVELPLPASEVATPLTVAGSASVFEGTVSLRLEADGETIAEGFATAEEGGPGRGDFEGMLEFHVDEPTDGTLVAFERSAEDNTEQNVVRVPVRLVPSTHSD